MIQLYIIMTPLKNNNNAWARSKKFQNWNMCVCVGGQVYTQRGDGGSTMVPNWQAFNIKEQRAALLEKHLEKMTIIMIFKWRSTWCSHVLLLRQFSNNLLNLKSLKCQLFSIAVRRGWNAEGPSLSLCPTPATSTSRAPHPLPPPPHLSLPSLTPLNPPHSICTLFKTLQIPWD